MKKFPKPEIRKTFLHNYGLLSEAKLSIGIMYFKSCIKYIEIAQNCLHKIQVEAEDGSQCLTMQTADMFPPPLNCCS